MDIPQSDHEVRMHWGLGILLRDGVRLQATLYEPGDAEKATPVIVTLTPYVAQTYHKDGCYFAVTGLRFLAVDVRGRGNSGGTFRPNFNEGRDGHDVIEWVARQSFCDGHVLMWGGSYAGHSQWAVAAQNPPHLAAIAPAASPYLGVDVPFRSNICSPYLI